MLGSMTVICFVGLDYFDFSMPEIVLSPIGDSCSFLIIHDRFRVDNLLLATGRIGHQIADGAWLGRIQITLPIFRQKENDCGAAKTNTDEMVMFAIFCLFIFARAADFDSVTHWLRRTAQKLAP